MQRQLQSVPLKCLIHFLFVISFPPFNHVLISRILINVVLVQVIFLTPLTYVKYFVMFMLTSKRFLSSIFCNNKCLLPYVLIFAFHVLVIVVHYILGTQFYIYSFLGGI